MYVLGTTVRLNIASNIHPISKKLCMSIYRHIRNRAGKTKPTVFLILRL